MRVSETTPSFDVSFDWPILNHQLFKYADTAEVLKLLDKSEKKRKYILDKSS